MNIGKDVISQLSEIISEKRSQNPKESYTAKLFQEGKVKIANKLGEEAIETISAFLCQSDNEVKEEVADLVYHLLVLLEHSRVSWEDILKTLEIRMKNDWY